MNSRSLVSDHTGRRAADHPAFAIDAEGIARAVANAGEGTQRALTEMGLVAMKDSPNGNANRLGKRSRMSDRAGDVGFEQVICAAVARRTVAPSALDASRSLICVNSSAQQNLQALRATPALRFGRDELGR
jgi:hypothetical protein